MQYKTELHTHSAEVSLCASVSLYEMADRYIAAGYTSLNLTNHFTTLTLDTLGDTWKKQLDAYFAPIRKMREYAKGKLHILTGAELRLDVNGNDYLLFGFTEDFFYDHPDLLKLRFSRFSNLCRDHGILLVQAHPFRNGMTVVRPDRLDGVEVFNGTVKHDARNDLALAWAKRYGLICTSGTDYHHASSAPVGGILTDTPICSERQLADVLRSGSYTLMCRGEAAVRDGMQDMAAPLCGRTENVCKNN